ncbi:MAG: hypothetical protein MHPSP_001197, partial [Paramarteilia canceri]
MNLIIIGGVIVFLIICIIVVLAISITLYKRKKSFQTMKGVEKKKQIAKEVN